MKQSSINLAQLILGDSLQKGSWINKFIYNWGITLHNGEEVLRPRNFYYGGTTGGRREPLDTAIGCVVSDTPYGMLNNWTHEYGMPNNCTYEYGLFDFLKTWNQLKEVDKGQIWNGWLYLNPRKVTTSDIYGPAIVNNLNGYISAHKDVNGRLTVSCRLLRKSIQYDVANKTFELGSGELYVPGWSTYEMVDQVSYMVNADGSLYHNAQGNTVQLIEKVPKYTTLQNALRNNDPRNEFIAGKLGGDANDPYEAMLARYGLWDLPADKVRISYVGEGLTKFTVADNNMVQGGTYDFGAGPIVAATGPNNIDTYVYSVVYDIPTYDITVVIEPGVFTASSTLVSKVLAELNADYTVRQVPWGNDVYNTPFIPLYMNNGYITYKEFHTLFPASAVVTNGYLDPFNSYVPATNWWVKVPTNDGVGGWLGRNEWCLKVGVLRGTIDTLTLDQRITLINKVLDSGYEEKARGNGVVDLVIIVVAVYAAMNGYKEGLELLGSEAGAIAMAAITFNVVISIGIAVAGSDYSQGGLLTKVAAVSAPVAQLAGIYLAVVGLYNGLDAATQGINQAASMTSEQIMEKMSTWISTKISTMTMVDGMRFAQSAFKMWSDNQLKDTRNDIAAKQKQVDDYNKAKEESKYNNLPLKMAQLMLNPLAQLGDSTQFDRPYEPVFGTMHTGCSCRTMTALYADGATTYSNNLV